MSNEITAYFKGRKGVCESVYQYDYGMVIILDSLENLTGSFDCFFSTSGEDEAIPAIGADNRVAIPNEALTRPGDVTLHVPMHSAQNDSEVEYVVTFRVIGRARPVDDGSEEDKSAISQAIALLRNPVENMEQIVNEALAYTGPALRDLQRQISSESSNRSASDAALTARIDNLVVAAGGSDVTEVVDARVGANGSNYGTLKTRIDREITELTDEINEYRSDVKLVKNLVPQIVVGKYCNYNNSGVITANDENRSYVRIPVEGGKTYSVSTPFSGNFSFWAYENEGTEYGISKISSFTTNYVITSPPNATILYLCNSGWNANTEIVVLETDISVIGARRADFPFNTVVKIEADNLVDLYNTIDILGISRFSKWERGGLRYIDGTSIPVADNVSGYLDARIRTPIARPIVLGRGDRLSINNEGNVTYGVAYYDSDESTWRDSGWITNDYVAPSNGNYYVVIRHSDNSAISIMEELSDAFTISLKNGLAYNLDERVAVLEGELPLPDYYYENDYFPNKIQEIKDAMSFANGVCFAFITDVHFPANAGKSKALLKEIIKKTSVPFVIYGGDTPALFGDSSTLEGSITTLTEYMDAVGKHNWYSVHGNHDLYCRTNATPTVYTRKNSKQIYNAMMRTSERYVTNMMPGHMCYCIDIPAQRTRFVILNSSDMAEPSGAGLYTDAQLLWLADSLKELSDTRIIVASHIPSDPVLAHSEASITAPAQNVLAACQARSTVTIGGQTISFADNTNTIICHINGHNHADENNFADGILSVVTTCDAAYRDDGHGMVLNTITEQALDIYFIDYNNKVVKTVRVGRGNNRGWLYTNGGEVS